MKGPDVITNTSTSELVHFITYLGEYSIIPIALWIFTYLPKVIENRRLRDISDERPEKDSFQTFGYEFVLIECLTFFALFLRIGTNIYCDISSNKFLFCLSLTTLICSIVLGLIFSLGWLLQGNAKSDTLISFKLTFYTSFSAWWLRVIVLCFYSHLFGKTLCGYISGVLVLLLCFSGTLYFFNKLIYHYFITWDIITAKLNRLVKIEEFTKAQKLGTRLIKRLQYKEGVDNHKAVCDSTIALAMAYYMERNPKKIDAATTLFKQVLEMPYALNVNMEVVYKVILALYTLELTEQREKEAEVLLIKGITSVEEQTKVREFVKNKQYSMFIPMDEVLQT